MSQGKSGLKIKLEMYAGPEHAGLVDHGKEHRLYFRCSQKPLKVCKQKD